MFQVKLSEATAARRRIPVLLVDITDGFTPETGVVTPTINISKNGATVATGAGTWTEIGNGQYYYEFTTGEVDTLGWIAVNIEKATVSRDYNAVVQIMAYDALDSVRLGLTALPNAAAGAAGGLPTGNASGQVTVGSTATGALTSTSFAANSLTASALATDAVTEITGGVWDEAYAGHTVAGSFGKLMDILRKSNYVTEGTVSASGAPANSTVYFRTSLTGVNNFYTSQTLLFVSGTLAGQAMNIETFTSTNGVVTSSDPLTATPTAGDAFVVLGEHVWSRAQIADAVLTRSLTTAGAANNIAITSISSPGTFNAVNTLVVDDQVTFVGTAPANFALGVIYYVRSSVTSTTFELALTPGGLGISTGSTGAFTATKVTGRDMLSAMRYLRNKVAISGSTMTVYQEDDVATAWTAALTTSPGVDPVTTIDPA